jgi:anaerobic selenocysteine-containing dehydrogenase
MTGLPVVRTAYTTCPLCEATCGLALTMSGDRISGVRGDPDDVFSHGYICPKGAAFGQLDSDPDRLRTPLVRRDGELRPAGWTEAFEAVVAGLGAVTDRYGRDAVALYLGNPTAHSLAGVLFAGRLRAALGSRNVYTASTLDQMPKHVACGYLFGHPLAIPVPDVDRTDLLLILGADPYTSNGSVWTVPDLPGRLRALRERGGRLIVVDPRRSRPAPGYPSGYRRLSAARPGPRAVRGGPGRARPAGRPSGRPRRAGRAGHARDAGGGGATLRDRGGRDQVAGP